MKNSLFLFSGAALLLAVADLPYGYYQFLRIFIFGVSVYAAHKCYLNNKIKWMWVFGVIAVIFNPFLRIHLDKETWQIIDIVTAVIQLVFFFAGGKKGDSRP